MNPETNKRKLIKAMSWRSVSGNWLKSVLLIFLSAIMSTLVLQFLPLREPHPSELATAKTSLEALMLFVPQNMGTRAFAAVGVTLLLYLFIIPPLNIGIYRFFLSVSRGRKAKLSEAFSVYTNLRDVFSAIFIHLIIAGVVVLLFVGLILVFIPVFFLLPSISLTSPVPSFIVTHLFAVASLFLLFWCTRYTFAMYILADGKNGGAWSSFRACLALVRGRSGECMKLRASYLIWDALTFYITPLAIVYNIISKAVYAKYLDYFRGDIEFVKVEISNDKKSD